MDARTIAEIDAHLKRREALRDAIAERARSLRRSAQSTMTRLHAGAPVTEEVARLRVEARKLSAWVRRTAPGDAGLTHDALQEAVEAQLLHAASTGARFPGPRALGVAPEEYLGGLGDTVGEVRRLVLADLADDRLGDAEEHLEVLEHLFQVLSRFETTRAIVALKPKQDTARALLEKTRGEVTLARVLARSRLPRQFEEHEG